MTNTNPEYPRVPYAMTVHDVREEEAVTNVLRTSTQMGVHTKSFESKVAKLYGKSNGIGVNSGTSALFLAMEALDLPEGSEVITPALTFATTAGCIVKNGLIPSFIDVEGATYCIDSSKVEEMVSAKTRAMCIPNLLGNIANWSELRVLAEKYDLRVLEDCADIIGATYLGEPVGTHSDICVASFYGMHIINCAGNGGMVCTSNEAYADKVRLLRSWGRSSSRFVESENIEERFAVELDGIQYDAKFVFETIGYNLEPSEIGSAFGLVQLEKLSDILDRRRAAFRAQNDFFKEYENWFILPETNSDADTVWFAFPLLVRKDAPFTRTEMQVFLEQRNIQTRVVFTGNINRQPGFQNINKRVSSYGYPQSDEIMRTGILLACHHGLDERMLEHMHDSFAEFAQTL